MQRDRMIKIEAANLEDAYTLAAQKLSCSIADLECEIIQHPRTGFLGFGKRSAVIVVNAKETTTISAASSCEPSIVSQNSSLDSTPCMSHATPSRSSFDFDATIAKYDAQWEEDRHTPAVVKHETSKDYDVTIDKSNELFYQEKLSMHEACEEIASKLNTLFEHACFKLDPVQVVPYAENIILVKFTGEDSALLIGKDGYRYKALSYMIFNWIHPKYGYFLRLEIAEFLQNQEDAVKRYLDGIVDTIRTQGKGQTKVLDGVLVQIALHELRKTFPDKNVVIKTMSDGARYVSVSPFVKKYEH